MKYYLTTYKETGNILKFLNTHKSNEDDSLIVIYPEKDDKISLGEISFSIIKEIRDAKCQIEFVESKTHTGDPKLDMAFTLGTVIGIYPDITILSDDILLKQFGSKGKSQRKAGDKPGRPGKKSTAAVKISDKETAAKPIGEGLESDKKEEKAVAAPEAKPEKAPVRSKKKSAEQDEFDKAYDAFEKFLESYKTKQFNPASHINTILKAIKNMEKEGTTIQDELAVWCRKPVADQIIITFSNDFDKMIKLAGKIKD